MSLESGETFFLDRNDDAIAFQQTGGAVVRSADPENPRFFFHLFTKSTMRTIVEVTEGAGHTRKKACVAQTNYSIRGFEDRASKKLNANFMARQRPKCYICTSKSGRSDDLFSISPSNASRAITRKFSSQLRRVP